MQFLYSQILSQGGYNQQQNRKIPLNVPLLLEEDMTILLSIHMCVHHTEQIMFDKFYKSYRNLQNLFIIHHRYILWAQIHGNRAMDFVQILLDCQSLYVVYHIMPPFLFQKFLQELRAFCNLALWQRLGTCGYVQQSFAKNVKS